MDKYRFTYEDIHRAVRSVARRVTAAAYEPDVIVAIGSGGFIPARILRTFMDRPILTVGVAYYDKDNKPTENPRKVQWIEEAERELRGRRILLVDEVDDSRATLEYCVRELMAHGPASIAVAVIHNKLKEKRGAMPPEVALYVAGLDIEDKWVCYPWDATDIDGHDRAAAADRDARKKALRAEMKARLGKLDAQERDVRSREAARGLDAMEAFAEAELVLSFLAMPGEIDTTPAIERALAQGKRVAVPRMAGGEIEFVELEAAWRSWPRDRWDIPEPPAALDALSVEGIARAPCLVMAPGLAFDADGGRLGRGKGYYDRFLARLANARVEAGSGAAMLALVGYGYQIGRAHV